MSATPSKSELRIAAVQTRADVAGDGNSVAKAVAEHFLAEFSSHIHKDLNVAGYWPINDELDDRALLGELHRRGCRCLLPVVVGKDEPLEFRTWSPATALAISDWGIAEPGPEQAAETPELVLTPLLAFDDQGWRLGYGGGYYDRSLAVLRKRNPGRILAVGLAYGGQRVDTVPHHDYDQRLDYVITEQGVSKF